MAYSGGYPDGYSDGGIYGSSALAFSVAGSVNVDHTLVGTTALTTTAAGAVGGLVGLAGTVALSTGASATGLTAIVGAAGSSGVRFTPGYADLTQHFIFAIAGSSGVRLTLDYADLTQHFTFPVEGRTQVVMGAAGTVGVNWALGGRANFRTYVYGTVVPDPTFTFIPPLVYDMAAVLPETHGVQRQLFRYYGDNPRGLSVVKVAGHYVTIDNPSADLLVGLEGSDWFLGGHNYVVSKATSAALVADGYVTA